MHSSKFPSNNNGSKVIEQLSVRGIACRKLIYWHSFSIISPPPRKDQNENIRLIAFWFILDT